MKTCGIISEYNPFHNGHLYQIEKTRQQGATHIVSVMSGNYVQRGDLACFSKQARAKSAVLNGVDLVIEIPTPMAMAPARNFAHGAVSILKNIGIDMISFGSECADVEILKETAKNIIKAENSNEFKQLLNQGKSHITARQVAVQKLFSKKYAEILQTPNNLLGIEYIIALSELDMDIEIFSLARHGVNHDSDIVFEDMSSASNLRTMLKTKGIEYIKNYVPKSAYEIYKNEIEQGKAPCDINKLNDILLYKIYLSETKQLKDIFDVTEGIENRILKAVNECSSFDEMVEYISTKRYTKARIRRILLNILLNIDNHISKSDIEYARILALNENGREILKLSKQKSNIFISPKFANIYNRGYELIKLEKKATDIYNLTAPKRFSMKNEFQSEVFVSYKNLDK